MQEATTFNIFYDGISLQHFATVLILYLRYTTDPGYFSVAHSVYSINLCVRHVEFKLISKHSTKEKRLNVIRFI